METKTNKNSLISFNCKASFGYIIAYWVCELLFRLFMYIEWDYFQIVENDADNEYLYILFLNIADLLSFFELLYNLITKKKNKESKYGNKVNTIPFHRYLIFFAIFGFDLFARMLFYVFHKSFDLDNEEVSQKFARDILIIVDILLRLVFNLCFMKVEAYNHKICPIVIILIIFLLLIIMDIIDLMSSERYDIYDCLLFLAVLSPKCLIFPLVDTIAKKMMVDHYVLPTQFMRYRGAYQFFFLIIITPILVSTSNLHFTSEMFSSKLALAGTIYIITNCVKYFLLLNVIYNYSSNSVSFLIISESLAGTINEIINFFKEKTNMSHNTNIIISIVEIILVFLIGILTMIYDEIIVINKCGLGENVRDRIDKRGIEDKDWANLNNCSEEDYIPMKEIQSIN